MFKSHVTRAVIESFIVAAIAYVLGYYFTAMIHLGTAEVGGLWAVISGVFVIAEGEVQSVKIAKVRILASFIGCVIAGAYLYFLAFNVFTFALAIALGVLICHLFRIPSHIKTTTITISVVVIISALKDIGPFANAFLRFFESVIGSLTAIVVGIAAIYILKLKKESD